MLENEVAIGDEVVIFGPDGPSAAEWGEWAKTINYEIVTQLSERVDRVENGPLTDDEVSSRILEQMRTFADAFAEHLRAGDLLILRGNLGAGKTTFTQSLGTALEVTGRITSPTFIIARVHPSRSDGPALVHVDAYRLSDGEELGDLDLDSELDESITVVEWGAGIAEQLSTDYLDITIAPMFDSQLTWQTKRTRSRRRRRVEDERRTVDFPGSGDAGLRA